LSQETGTEWAVIVTQNSDGDFEISSAIENPVETEGGRMLNVDMSPLYDGNIDPVVSDNHSHGRVGPSTPTSEEANREKTAPP